MNKHQFLAELSQYLSFLSAEDRTRVLEAYSTRFEALEPEQEFALAAELGSPMRVAIELKRRLEAGECIVEKAEENADPEEDSPLLEEDSSAEEAIEDEDVAVAEEAPADELDLYSVETETEEALLYEETPEADAPAVPAKAPPAENAMRPSGAKLIFALIGASLLSILIAAFFLGLAAVGGGFLVAMSHLMIAGLKNLQSLTNALLLFAGGLTCLSLGLVIVWFSVWSAICLIRRIFGDARRTGLRYTDKEAN